MSAMEFQEWRVMFAMEGWGPRARRHRHAELRASIATGALRRRGSPFWPASDFTSADPWAPPPPPKAPLTSADIRAQVAAHNKSKRKQRH